MKGALFSEKTIVAIDVGTTKISVLIARVIQPDQLEIVGLGKVPSHGLEKGVVVDVAAAVSSIKEAVQEAEITAGCSIESAYVGISGAHISSQQSEGMVSLKHNEVRAADIAEVLASARAINIPKGQQILHVLPHHFIIDGQQKVREPLGLCGLRLEAQVHVITGSVALVNNLVKCCNLAGVNVADIVLEQLASACAVLSHDERQLGAAVLDIGGGTSDLAIYHRGAVFYTSVIPIAGTNFTNDLAIGLHTTLKEAERVKIHHGTIIHGRATAGPTIEIVTTDGISTQTISEEDIIGILQPRAQELLNMVAREILKTDMKVYMPAGLVLTGGGALLCGMSDLAQTIFGIPVRVGMPSGISAFGKSIAHPSFATGYGLLRYALQKKDTAITAFNGPAIMRIVARMRSWVSELF